MNPGKLNRRIILQSKVVTPDTYGGEVISWKSEGTVWAEIKPISGREYFMGKIGQDETTHRIRIRFFHGLLPFWRVKYKDRIFNIQSVLDLMEDDREMDLMCIEERVSTQPQ